MFVKQIFFLTDWFLTINKLYIKYQILKILEGLVDLYVYLTVYLRFFLVTFLLKHLICIFIRWILIFSVSDLNARRGRQQPILLFHKSKGGSLSLQPA